MLISVEIVGFIGKYMLYRRCRYLIAMLKSWPVEWVGIQACIVGIYRSKIVSLLLSSILQEIQNPCYSGLKCTSFVAQANLEVALICRYRSVLLASQGQIYRSHKIIILIMIKRFLVWNQVIRYCKQVPLCPLLKLRNRNVLSLPGKSERRPPPKFLTWHD